MPTTEERIAAIKARMTARKDKIENMPSIQRAKAADAEDAAQITKLEVDGAKEAASKRRKEDARSKIVLAAGVMLLPHTRQTQIVHEVMGCLTERDQDLLRQWFAGRGIDLEISTVSNPDVTSGSASVDGKLIQVLGRLDEGSREWLTSELLSRTSGEDRAVIEALIVALSEGERLRDRASVSSGARS